MNIYKYKYKVKVKNILNNDKNVIYKFSLLFSLKNIKKQKVFKFINFSYKK